eukprot:CAMPEP_0194219582 /NCGR_PEP_ID=MMETSP0156-20130528/26330_1 /TAXON_ID=33649 /ORGANISM="Thalassionema nitzschioides, Strain L26-B" /LENGTH=621 /DNA_ID=CAMNT_0038949315 /DNA_START=186 /DNA_END=2051 /DNA_ORIENTATION=+
MNTPPSKIPKPRTSRKSMAPRVGRENSMIPPPSPSASVVSSSSNLPPRNSRRSTMGGGRRSIGVGRGAGSTVLKQDPRQIHDKAYQTHGLKMLLKFLTDSGYEYQVSLKSLSRPSGKDFSHIVTFLLRHIDPTFGSASELKFEEEVALQFKSMGYPFPLSKTALVAAGSPHTWPALMAALIWLVEHITVVMKAEEVEKNNLKKMRAADGFESLQELETKTDKAFFLYLHEAYKAFLAGDEADQYTEELVDMFEQDNMVIEREIERVTDMNGSMVEKVNLLQEQGATLPTMSKKREEYATDLEQFHDLVRQMDEHRAALAKKVEERTQELHETNSDLEKVNAQIEKIRHKVSEQELSVEDVQKMNSEEARLKEALEKAQSLQKFQKEGLYKSKTEFDNMWEDLELLVREYTQEASELSRWMDLRSVSWKMTLKKTGALTDHQPDLLNVDIPNELQPFLREGLEKNVTLFTSTKEELQSMLDELELSNEDYTEAVDRKKLVLSKLEKVQETSETEREQQDATLQVRLNEVESLQSKIDALQNPAAVEQQIFESQRQYDKLEALHRKHIQDTIVRKQELQNDIQTALDAVHDFHRHVEERLQEIKQYAQEKKQSLSPNFQLKSS